MDRLKALKEQRNELLNKLDKLLDAAEAETRALSEEEQREFDEIGAEISKLDGTIKAIEKRDALEQTEAGSAVDEVNTEEAEERAFADYLRGAAATIEARADTNFTPEKGEAIIPTSIAHRIMVRVEEICPIYSMATHYNVGGTLQLPYYDESEQRITVAYAEEFKELESTAGEFKSISLRGFLAGVLSLISRSLINNAQFDVVSIVVERMAVAVSRWLERELLFGTTDKVEGLSKISTDMTVTAASSAAITADELIDVQETVPDVFQSGCVWIMGKKLRTAIRKLKDGEGNYLLNKDATSRWGYTLFGKDVYVSDAMEKEEKAPALFYGDFSGLAVKITENMAIDVLREKYATQHAVGIVGWMEIDAKIENAQKIACLKYPV